jgi:hypothetical protein
VVRNHDLGQTGVTLDQSNMPKKHPLKNTEALVRSLRSCLGAEQLQLLVKPVKNRGPNVFFSLKVAEDSSLGEADQISNLLRAHRIGTPLGHEPQDYLDDLLFAFASIKAFFTV